MFRWSILFTVVFILQFILFSDTFSVDAERNAQPTNGEGNALGSSRENWLNMVHNAAPGTNWRKIEYDNNLHRVTTSTNQIQLREDCGSPVITAGGEIQGVWKERGSSNQAGSAIDTEFDPVKEEVFLIAAGGSLWKGQLDGENWEVLNEEQRFSPGILKFIPTPNGSRLLAFINRMPHYSDDRGLTWEKATGIQYLDGFGDFSDVVIVKRDQGIHIYCLIQSGRAEKISLFCSKDLGKSYQLIHNFKEKSIDHITLANAHQDTNLFCLIKNNREASSQFFQISDETENSLISLPFDSTFNFGSAPANLKGWKSDEGLTFLTYKTERGITSLYASTDLGETWEKRGDLPSAPWEVGIYISPSDPDYIYYGEVHAFRSADGGRSWRLVNTWWDYYEDVETKIHADIMHFQEFKTSEGEPFLLVSNHGGLNISYDNLGSNLNISLQDLNISQYYSVRTSPIDPQLIYAGSQDQGLQFADSSDYVPSQPLNFTQITPGDFGHVTFTNDGSSVWASYPGGSIFFYENASSGQVTTSFTLDSKDESVWLAPVQADPFALGNVVFMAGGNLNGGEGSFLIRLEVNENKITSSQIDFDFKAASDGGVISAIAISPLDPSLWYIATTNGRFFISEDAGQTWSKNLEFIPVGQYLYGQTILASQIDENIVYLGGSGYSNSPVYKSVDKGTTFIAMNEGLPSTLMTDLTASEGEELLFAATESGPFVFVKPENRWYPMGVGCVPNQTFWSVEYLTEEKMVRFGTYGRGIWDFKIEDFVITNTKNNLSSNFDLKIFPNPTNDWIFVKASGADLASEFTIQMININGQEVFSGRFPSNRIAELSLADLESGYYILNVFDQDNFRSQSVIVHR